MDKSGVMGTSWQTEWGRECKVRHCPRNWQQLTTAWAQGDEGMSRDELGMSRGWRVGNFWQRKEELRHQSENEWSKESGWGWCTSAREWLGLSGGSLRIMRRKEMGNLEKVLKVRKKLKSRKKKIMFLSRGGMCSEWH